MKDFLSTEEIQQVQRTTLEETLDTIKNDAYDSMKETKEQLGTLEIRSLIFRVLKCVGLGGSVACGINLLVSTALTATPQPPSSAEISFNGCTWEASYNGLRELKNLQSKMYVQEHGKFTSFRDNCLNIGIVMLASAMMFTVSYFCEDTKNVAIAKIASEKYRGLQQSVKQYVAGRFLSDSIEDIEKQTKKFRALQSDIHSFVTPVEFENK